MRMILLAGLMSMTAVTAHADSSIDVVKTDDSARSIDFIKCTGCAPLRLTKEEKPEVVLKPGTQKIELKTINGELKVFRTEAWLGGSPVTYVSKASTDLMDKQTADAVPADQQNVQPIAVDKEAVTAAKDPVTVDNKDKVAAVNVDTSNGAEATVTIDKDTTSSTTADMSSETTDGPKPKVIKAFNPQNFQLRLN